MILNQSLFRWWRVLIMVYDDLLKIKLYCKVDQDFEDDLIIELVESVELQISDAIETGSNPTNYSDDPRFKLAVKKQVKEEYENRGITSDTIRYPLANGVLNIIHQLRYKQQVEVLKVGVVVED